jgi:hypothetical protein
MDAWGHSNVALASFSFMFHIRFCGAEHSMYMRCALHLHRGTRALKSPFGLPPRRLEPVFFARNVLQLQLGFGQLDHLGVQQLTSNHSAFMCNFTCAWHDAITIMRCHHDDAVP